MWVDAAVDQDQTGKLFFFFFFFLFTEEKRFLYDGNKN